MVLTFTSSHIALSSARTRVVWSGVEGTTMDFCRAKTHADGSAVAETGTGICRRTHTLIQGWFINCVMVILSLGSVFRSRWIRFLAKTE